MQQIVGSSDHAADEKEEFVANDRLVNYAPRCDLKYWGSKSSGGVPSLRRLAPPWSGWQHPQPLWQDGKEKIWGKYEHVTDMEKIYKSRNKIFNNLHQLLAYGDYENIILISTYIELRTSPPLLYSYTSSSPRFWSTNIICQPHVLKYKYNMSGSLSRGMICADSRALFLKTKLANRHRSNIGRNSKSEMNRVEYI